METVQTTYDKTGRYRSRQWTDPQLRTRVDEAATLWASSPLIPSDAAHAEVLRQRKQAVLDAFDAWQAGRRVVPVVPPPPIPEEVLKLLSAEAAVDEGAVDRRIESTLEDIQSVCQGKQRRPEGDPRGEAARLILETLFVDGRRFTRLSLAQQQTTTADRLADLQRVAPAAAATLDLEDELGELAALNAWLGKLLRLGERPQLDGEAPAPVDEAKPEPVDARQRLRDAITALLTCAHTLWPEDTPAHVHARAQIVGPFLREIFA